MNINKIIISHLKSIGADGLAGDECGCGIDALMPCSDWSGCGDCRDCVPAKKVIATEAGECHDIGDVIYTKMEENR
jgi:hypothetical protein